MSSVTRFTDHTYIAEIVLEAPGGDITVDARPSDAINVALIAGVPIQLSDSLLNEWASQIAHIPLSVIEVAVGGSLEGEWQPRWQQPPEFSPLRHHIACAGIAVGDGFIGAISTPVGWTDPYELGSFFDAGTPVPPVPRPMPPRLRSQCFRPTGPHAPSLSWKHQGP